MWVQRLLSDVGRPRRPKTAPLASDDAAQIHERRAGELKPPALMQRPRSKVGRPSVQSLYEGALAAKVRAGPDSTRHITDQSVPVGWKRDMSVLPDVQQVFVSAGHVAIEEHEQEHEQEHEPAAAAAAEPPRKKQRTRVAKHHIHWFLSLADRLLARAVRGGAQRSSPMCTRTPSTDGSGMALPGVLENP